jgi:hypothetical protein
MGSDAAQSELFRDVVLALDGEGGELCDLRVSDLKFHEFFLASKVGEVGTDGGSGTRLELAIVTDFGEAFVKPQEDMGFQGILEGGISLQLSS